MPMLSENDKTIIRLGAYIASLEQQLMQQAQELEEYKAQAAAAKDPAPKE